MEIRHCRATGSSRDKDRYKDRFQLEDSGGAGELLRAVEIHSQKQNRIV